MFTISTLTKITLLLDEDEKKNTEARSEKRNTFLSPQYA